MRHPLFSRLRIIIKIRILLLLHNKSGTSHHTPRAVGHTHAPRAKGSFARPHILPSAGSFWLMDGTLLALAWKGACMHAHSLLASADKKQLHVAIEQTWILSVTSTSMFSTERNEEHSNCCQQSMLPMVLQCAREERELRSTVLSIG